jgi:hypothetical protein
MSDISSFNIVETSVCDDDNGEETDSQVDDVN